MSKETSDKSVRQVGPYSETLTKTIKILPIEITITTKTESTHVPPVEDYGCGCGGDPEFNLGDMISRAASSVMPGVAPMPSPFPADDVPADSK